MNCINLFDFFCFLVFLTNIRTSDSMQVCYFHMWVVMDTPITYLQFHPNYPTYYIYINYTTTIFIGDV